MSFWQNVDNLSNNSYHNSFSLPIPYSFIFKRKKKCLTFSPCCHFYQLPKQERVFWFLNINKPRQQVALVGRSVGWVICVTHIAQEQKAPLARPTTTTTNCSRQCLWSFLMGNLRREEEEEAKRMSHTKNDLRKWWHNKENDIDQDLIRSNSHPRVLVEKFNYHAQS